MLHPLRSSIVWMWLFSISLIVEYCSLPITGCFVIKDVLKCRSLKYLWESVSFHWTLLNLSAWCFTLRMTSSLFPRLLEFTFQVWGAQCHWLFSTFECLSFCKTEHKLLIVKIAQYPLVFWWMALSLLRVFQYSKTLQLNRFIKSYFVHLNTQVLW